MGDELLAAIGQLLRALSGGMFAGGITFVIMLLWTRRRRRQNLAHGRRHPLCRRCEYLLIGLESCTCPECGSDLGRPGAVTVTTRREKWKHRSSFVFLALMLSFVGWQVADYATSPKLRALWVQMTGPASQAYGSVSVITSDVHDFTDPLDRIRRRVDLSRVASVQVEVSGQNRSARYEILADGQPLHPRSYAAATVAADSFSREMLAGWFRDQHIAVDSPQVEAELAVVTELIQRLLQGQEHAQRIAAPHFQHVSVRHEAGAIGGSYRRGLRDWPLLVIGGVPLIICWGTAVILILMLRWWIRRERMQRLDCGSLPLDLARMCLQR